MTGLTELELELELKSTPHANSSLVFTISENENFIFGGAPKSLQMVTAAMKLKDACSLEEKLWLN